MVTGDIDWMSASGFLMNQQEPISLWFGADTSGFYALEAEGLDSLGGAMRYARVVYVPENRLDEFTMMSWVQDNFTWGASNVLRNSKVRGVERFCILTRN